MLSESEALLRKEVGEAVFTTVTHKLKACRSSIESDKQERMVQHTIRALSLGTSVCVALALYKHEIPVIQAVAIEAIVLACVTWINKCALQDRKYAYQQLQKELRELKQYIPEGSMLHARDLLDEMEIREDSIPSPPNSDIPVTKESVLVEIGKVVPYIVGLFS